GDTYTYMVSYVYFDACSQLNETSPPSSSLCAQTCGSGCSSPEVLITGNQAEMGDSGYSFIQTYDLADGSFLFQFIPGGTQTDEPNGRGLAVSGSEIFYSEVPQNSWGPWGAPGNWIHVCPYGTEGSGGSDTRTIPNPDTRTDANGDSAWISALAFQYDPNQGKTELFALTGYELGAGLSQQYPRKVYELDPTTGAVVGPASGVTLTGTADGGGYATLGSDGFTVLPNGHFIVNEDDASPIYDEYGANGVLIPQSQGGIRVNLDTSEFRDYPSGTGVAVAPDGQSLYFIANVNGQNQVVIQTDLTGNNPKFYPVDGNGIENIGITVLQ
ncbi:MAG TPA: hypothetical protein VGR89_06595, partial [Puia sp.]|nr:hypothetical protein [Puia sp.]